MHPFVHAAATPDKPAIIVAETGEVRTYGQLEEASNRVAQFVRSRGLQHEDVIALMLENSADYFSFVWGAQRAGLRYVCISSRLTADETDYIIENSGAKIVVLSSSLAPLAAQLKAPAERYSFGGEIAGWAPLEDVLATMPVARIADERAGVDMLYSSGTTGRPKGVRIPLPPEPSLDAPNALLMLTMHLYGFAHDSIYISPAPLYHAAPLRFCMSIHKLGGTVVMMEKFDPENVLRFIDHYKATCGQFVPTHFVRMLKLPPEVRAQYDISSLKSAVHAAAPCPIPVKEGMINWWGPVIHEYYAGSEGNGMTYISSADWLAHKGSVGRPVLGTPHIMEEDGETKVAQGKEGVIYFESEVKFEYHGDQEKTQGSRNSKGWSTLGDVGYLDPEGFLFLTDRKSFMIISGGVNIYPQEIENHLVTHPKVQDVAVVGGPHEEMGEEVIAVIQPIDMANATDTFREELVTFARERLSGVKIPRRIDFLAELPRHDTGKLYKRLLRDQYWEKTNQT